MLENSDRPKPLFVIGSKRSGSTLTVNLLNRHPRVFVSHESDIGWILYQAREGIPAEYEAHPLDSELMMTSTLDTCGRMIEAIVGRTPTAESLADAFYAVQFELLRQWSSLRWRFMSGLREFRNDPRPIRLWEAVAGARSFFLSGGPRLRPAHLEKEQLAWLGDKKHAQLIDPPVHAFLRDLLPKAKFLHVIRHPRGVVASMEQAARQWSVLPAYFEGTASEVLEQWAVHEEWVLEAKERHPDSVHSIRLEDLCSEPRSVLESVFDFLALDPGSDFEDRIDQLVTQRDPNHKYIDFALPELPRARRVMALYDYQ